ncbi:MAG: DUF4258 domain-containing protein [Desulfobulbaceae bacterium]|nr:DUF4258 domain-containing protein [Desulfobulbaceae bacterium]
MKICVTRCYRKEGTTMNGMTCTVDEFIPNVTSHARLRMGSRGISLSEVAIAMSYGRNFHVRGAIVYAMGRKELASCQRDGIQTDGIAGLQVICAPESEKVITVYRNNDFRRLRRRNTRWHPEQAELVHPGN